MGTEQTVLLKMSGITKRFPGTLALNKVQLLSLIHI